MASSSEALSVPEEVPTNMEVLEPSKRRLRVGDIFAFRVRGHPYRFGRVIRTDAKAGPFDKLVLIYLYAPTSPERDKIPELRVDNLLVPPLLTNRLPWSRGYFVAVDNRQLSDADVLAVHCFEDSRGNLYDEMSNEIDHRVEPMGEFGVQSFRTIDDLISDAVGVPRVPDE